MPGLLSKQMHDVRRRADFEWVPSDRDEAERMTVPASRRKSPARGWFQGGAVGTGQSLDWGPCTSTGAQATWETVGVQVRKELSKYSEANKENWRGDVKFLKNINTEILL